MALNFTVSYTFSPNTTISSSQVNTNFSDIAAVFQGLEAETKTLSKLKMDADPTIALEVATKQYVDHYSTWRRPVLQFGSTTTVAVESGLDGTSGDIPILFPDGSMRTETSTTRTTFNITRNAVLTTSGAQSGLTGATSEATNTWYALYAVKVTDSSTQWVTVGSTVLPLQSNYSTLNTAYGTSGWVYLGLIRNGDNSGATGDILDFVQAGNMTIFKNTVVLNYANTNGIKIAGSDSTATLSYTRSLGTGTTDIPANVMHVLWGFAINGGSGGAGVDNVLDYNGVRTYHTVTGTVTTQSALWWPAVEGIKLGNTNTVKMQISIGGFIDGVLGVGSNPIL